MPIYIYNSLTQKKEEFLPLNPPNVNMYTCGVTVYDECHIGHARSLFVFDIIKRYLNYRGYKVKFVRNITDIDDKIINKAKEEKVSWKEISEKYIRKYYDDLDSLGIERADFEPKATENIPQMIKIIEKFIKKGFAYQKNSDVYFRVRNFNTYGKLSHQRLEDILVGARIEPSEFKEDPLDFCLWKGTRDEHFWDSPWGNGRPGWHIECSAMAIFYLGETLDIHGGGLDLIFPHHENEIAQSESYTEEPFSKYWLHHGLLTINGEKMAKSLGNFISVQDVLKRYSADVLKLFFLSSHYRSTIDFTFSKLEEAKGSLEKILIVLNKIGIVTKSQKSVTRKQKFKELEEIKEKFLKSMDDDFNTPSAVSYLFKLVNTINKRIKDLDFVFGGEKLLWELVNVFGLALKLEKPEISEEEIDLWIEKRDRARKMKDFELADRIRKDLEKKGIILEDGRNKTTWRRKI